jgi:AcrR family transcriptional regulator
MEAVSTARRRSPRRRAGAERRAYRKQPTQARAQATVDVILAAARRVLIRTGYEKFTTNHVAKLAGVSIGSLYQYFPSKRALVAALLEQHVDRSVAELQKERKQLASSSVDQVVRRLTEWMVESHQRDPELHRIIVKELPRHGLHSRNIEAGFEHAIASMRRLLEHHARELTPQNHELTAFIIVHTIESLTKAALARNPGMLNEELIGEVHALLMRYIGSRG